jgi:hypothetical protein
MAGKLNGRKNPNSAAKTHLNAANLRKGYTNTKEKQPPVKKKTGYHQPFDRNGHIIKLLKKKSTYI